MKFRTLALLAVLLPFLVSAEEKQLAFRSLTADDGLTHNAVLAILQDRIGFMWFGTKDGLNRYDGTEIRSITVEDAIPGNNYIRTLCEDGDGRIWMGTDAGVCIYDPGTERARRFLERSDDGTTISGNIPNIVMAPDSTIWICGGSQGFFRYDPAIGKLTHIVTDKTGTRTYTARNICFTPQGTAYIALDDGNIYFSDDGLESVAPLFSGNAAAPFHDHFINRLVSSTFNRIYVCSSRGLFEVNPAHRQYRKIDLPHSNDYVRDIHVVGYDEIWVATESCLEILDGNMQVSTLPQADHDIPYTLQRNAFYCLCKDNEGGMWAGTYFSGVFYSRAGNSTSVRRYYAGSDKRQSGRYIREIVTDKEGNLWIGSESKGLFRFHPSSEEIEPIPGRELYENGLYSNVHGLCCDGDYIWAGTYEQTRTLTRIHRRTLASKSYPSAGKEIYTICKTAYGNLWLGTTSGLKRYDPAADRFIADTAIRNPIHHLKEDSSGNLWAATLADGLYKYDALKDSWQHFVYNEQDTTSLAANKVLSVFEDSRMQLWITTEGGGLCRYVPGQNVFVRYKRFLPFDTCYRIEEDAHGVFWITSNKGLIRFDAANRSYFVFTTDDGLLNNQFNYSSLCKTPEGRIYAGSNDGFISFVPEELKPHDKAFPIVLTDFMLYNQRVGVDNDSSPLKKSITQLDRLLLAPDENSFSLRVTAVNYQSPHQVRMRYRLEGFDTGWNRVLNNTITYSNLPYRTYRLVVEDLCSNGEPNGAVRTLEIRIRPPFYLSRFAQICYVLSVLAMIAGLYKIAVRRSLREREKAIEKIERQKERELYVSKFDFFTNVAHEIRTPLSLIRGPLEDLAERTKNKLDPEAEENIDTMIRNTDRLATLINQLLDFRKAERQGFKLHPVECDVREVIESICIRFVTMARQKHIALTFDLPAEKQYAAVDREALTKIVSNLLSNALKYSQTYARLEMTVAEKPEVLQIAVTNDGAVVPEQMREQIFLPFMQYRDGKHLITGTGIGLTLARALATQHGGTLHMDDDLSVNRFVLTIPIEHLSSDTQSGTSMPSAITDHTEAEEFQQNGIAAKPSVLIVEDDPEMQAFIARHLSAIYETVTADNGCLALEKLTKRPFDLILSDVMMPEMDGFELCRCIKSDLQFSHIPLLLLTAKTDMTSKVEGLGAGADAYIEKPFSLEYLRASIATLLSNRELVRRHFLESPLVKSETLTYSKTDEDFMRKLDEYIMHSMEQSDLSVDDIANEMCMSNSSLFRKLKGIIGKNPNEYLRIKRLKRAAELLQQDEYNITDISLLVGFRSQSYFSSCFKKQFGITPTEFLEERRGNSPDER